MIEVALFLQRKGEVAVSIRHLAGGEVCISTVFGWLLSGVLLSAAIVDGTGEAVWVSTDNGFFSSFFFFFFFGGGGGVDTACGTKVAISSSLLSQSLGACGVLFFFLVIRPPAFTLLGELWTHRALFRFERWIKLFSQKRCFFNIRLRIGWW